MKTKRRSTKKRTTRKGGGWPFFKSSNKFKEYYDLTNKLKKTWQKKLAEYNSEFGNYIKFDLNEEDNISKLCDNLINLTSQYMNQNESSYNINEIKNMYDDINKRIELIKFIYKNLLRHYLINQLKDLKSYRWKEVPSDEYNSILNMVEDTITTAGDDIHAILYEEYDNIMIEELIDKLVEDNTKTNEYFMYLLNKYRNLFIKAFRGTSSISGIGSSMI